MAFGDRRFRRVNRWGGRRLNLLAVTAIVAVLSGVTAGIAPVEALASGTVVLPVQHDKNVPVYTVTSHYAKMAAPAAWHPKQPKWPTGSADATLTATSAAQAGTLPVWVAPVAGKPVTHASGNAATTATKKPAPGRVHIDLAPAATAKSLGINGIVLSAQPVTDNAPADAAHITLNYGQFENAFGGDWSSRLHLIELPTCALTTPNRARCRTQTPLASTNDATTSNLSADIALPSSVVVAATSDASGGGGDYAATSLKPSGSWQAGGSTDSFTYSYPITVPSVPGGLEPNISLSYDSQSVDGLTSSTNNQASWIGDGWDYSPGYIERSYQSCHQNPTGVTKTWDNCWSDANTLTLSLNGQNTTLVKDDASGTYHPQNDDHERVQYLTGAANDAQNGEHFVVTTTDGTQYYFGLNKLPGWETSSDPVTNSVWTEPVFATASGQPCYSATFADSWCQQAYRWNLDYVVDTHSDVVSYFYADETNFYARDLGSTASTTYVRGGYLTKAEYGQRAGDVYTTSPAAQVVFTSTGRCDQPTCDPATLSSSTASHWPDVPFDLNCTQNASCTNQSPAFWSNYLLQKIQTQTLVGSTETNVDSWTFAHTFPDPGDETTSDPGTDPAAWLLSIIHSGQDTTAGGSSSAITLPAVTFAPVALVNRVQLRLGYPALTRMRMHKIVTETGETVTVAYSAPGCASGTPAEPSLNTALCFPDFWTPVGQTAPIMDWFNKFIVTGITEDDPTGGSAHDSIATTYTPVGSPAWHYNDNPTTPADQRTWDDWRGYQGMKVTQGTAPDPVTETQYTYFRGMDGDTLSDNGTRHASVTDSRSDPAITDLNQYSGMTYETIVYNGSSVVTDTIDTPWSSPATATQALPGTLPAQQAFQVDVDNTKVYTPLASGSTRETETDYTHDTAGRVTKTNDLGDTSTSSDDLCTTTSFADNTTAWILDQTAESKTVSVNCGVTSPPGSDVVSDELTFYDGSVTIGGAPSVGDATKTQDLISDTDTMPTYATTTDTYDEYGRTLSETNPDNDASSTTYTPATGAEPTQTVAKDPLGHLTTTTMDPLRDLTLSTKDAAGFVTTEQYDALGRLTQVNKPGITDPSLKFTYTVSDTGPSVVDTSTLDPDGSYRLSETLYDSMLRSRETQTQVLTDAAGVYARDITDTVYNSDGWESSTTDPFFNGQPVSPTLVQAQAGDVPSETAYTYDGDGRKTADIANSDSDETWRTTYTYGGNFTTTVSPPGGTAETTFTDARGNTTDLYQYHDGVPADPLHDPASDYSDTHYTYTPAGKQATVVDSAGNTWSYRYDLLGDITSQSDPDIGTVANTYDAAGQLLTTTDARGKQTTTAYDNGGRKIATYDTTGDAAPSTANKTAAWTYDNTRIGVGSAKAIGYPSTTTSFTGGDTYEQNILQYDTQAQATSVTTTLTGTDAALVPTAGYTSGYGYTTTGYSTGHSDSAAGGLPTESITPAYDQFGEPTSLAGADSYVTAVGYSELGQPLLYTMPGTGGDVRVAMAYDQQTQALTDVTTVVPGLSTAVDHTSYGYGGHGYSKGTGLVTAVTDLQNGGATTDTQCFTYDYAQRLSEAWTATDACGTVPSAGSSSTVGGPSPYWQSWTYDVAGDRSSETDHDVSGNSADDTTTAYHYPAAGSATDQPHTLTSTTSVGPNAASQTASFGYDASGNTTSISGGPTGDQTLTWNDQDELASDTTTSGSSTYVYDADGNLLVERDPGQTTLFLGDEQLVLNTGTGAITGTRYYTIGTTTIAARTGDGNPAYLVPDRQGTDQLTIDSATFAVNRRQFLPFGQARGAVPTTWLGGNDGYVGGTTDTATGLENLGAREYDAATGRFVSADPVFEASDPTQMAGYDYAGNDPVTGSDPTGLCPPDKCGGGMPKVGGGFTSGPIDPSRPWLGNIDGKTIGKSGANKSTAPVIHTYKSGLTTSRHGGHFFINSIAIPKFADKPWLVRQPQSVILPGVS